MFNVSTIFPTNSHFCFKTSRNIILASCQASFLQNTLSSFDLFFLSSLFPFGFLGVDFGICNSLGLVLRFLDGETLFKTFVGFNSPFFKLWFEFKTLEGKCIERWNILYHRNMLIKTYRNMAIKNCQFFFRFANCEIWNMIVPMNEGWNFS